MAGCKTGAARVKLLREMASELPSELFHTTSKFPFLDAKAVASILLSLADDLENSSTVKKAEKKRPSKKASPTGSISAVMKIDGASRGNPGPAAAAAIIEVEGTGTTVRSGKSLGYKTNNYAEYSALIVGLEKAIELGVSELTTLSDSELLVRQMNGQYSVKNPDILQLKMKADTLIARFKKVTFSHVRRELNAEADALANDVLDGRFGG